MDQFLVPQFIETEDKILGPLTVRQFLEMLAGALIGFIAYSLADLALFLVILVLDVILVGVLAFLKVNGMPFHYFLLNLIQTFKKPKIRVWYREILEDEVQAAIKKPEEHHEAPLPTKSFVGESQLAELSLMVDTGGAYQGETILPDNQLLQNKKKL